NPGYNEATNTFSEQPKIKEKASFNVYPNPTNGIVKIDWETLSQKPNSVQIFDITGKLLVTKNIAANELSTELNIAEFTNGMYLVKIISKDGNTVVKKVFKQD
ncbi:MAG: T9SS type A sorting domain-containing protein, partial [Bacteroidia bacterium]|nr:T9SS type A sorting domain-containing protein [Bacteroidia bacterium]